MDLADFPSFQKKSFAALIAATKSARQLSSEDVAFNRSLDSKFGAALDATNVKILGLVNKLAKNAAEGSEVHVENYEDADSLETGWPVIAEVVDFLLEKADICLDEYTGVIKKGKLETVKPTPARNPLEIRKLLNKTLHMPKPQLGFKRKIDPLSDSPFEPYLSNKPHSLRSLEDSTIPVRANGRERYPHPYEHEIWQLQYPSCVFQASEPIPYKPFNETSAIWVETPETLASMLAELKMAKEIAIDLEHHDNRSYIGIVCLMQISTREQDWIVDTIKLRDELNVLNEVFTDPSIVKVLHGAFMDIIWLQRDLGIYVVGLFDTYDACRELGFSAASLAFLLKKYIDFDADKRYQLADWRVRPLPQEMLDYARSDTHFLLYIYDNVRNELIDRSTSEHDLTASMLEASRETSLKLYENEPYDWETGKGGNGWANVMKRNPTNFNAEQFSVFRAVHQWRDQQARMEDESLNYVMGKHHVFNLARQMPKDVPGVFIAVSPASPVVKRKTGELVEVVRRAKENAPPLASIDPSLLLPRPPTHRLSNPAQTAAVASTENNKSEIKSIVYDNPHLKTPTSTFWADTYGGSRWQIQNLVNGMQDVSLALPLPKLTAAVFTDPSETIEEEDNDVEVKAERPEHEYMKHRPLKEETNEVIIVKQLGGVKKRKLPSSAIDVETPRTPSEDAEPTDIGGDEQEDTEVETKEQKKRRRKEEKAALKAAKEAASTRTQEEEAVAFDYKTAPSILHGKKNTEQKGFDPYSQTGKGPKASRKGKKDREGKSFTFRN